MHRRAVGTLSPAVAHLLARANVPVARIVGSGPRGRVLKGDVLRHLRSGPHTAPMHSPSDEHGASITAKTVWRWRGVLLANVRASLDRDIANLKSNGNLPDTGNGAAEPTVDDAIAYAVFRALQSHPHAQHISISVGNAPSASPNVSAASISEFITKRHRSSNATPIVVHISHGSDVVAESCYMTSAEAASDPWNMLLANAHPAALSSGPIKAANVSLLDMLPEKPTAKASESIADIEARLLSSRNAAVSSLLSKPVHTFPPSGFTAGQAADVSLTIDPGVGGIIGFSVDEAELLLSRVVAELEQPMYM